MILKNQHWNEETILKFIRIRRTKGLPIYSHHMRLNYQELLAAGIRYFGSWKNAVLAAGYSYDEVRKYKEWTQESIITTIQELSLQGVDLSFRSMMLGTYAPMVYAAIRKKYFGSWRKALTAAGLPSEEIYRYRSWDESSIVARIQELHEQGADLSSKKMDETENSLIATARRHFGSWECALAKAGIDYDTVCHRKRWTKVKVILGIKALARKRRMLTGAKAKRLEPALFIAASKPYLFGNWKIALAAARAYRPNRKRNRSAAKAPVLSEVN